MLISVIVPVYNTEHYLSVCIDSILSQTYADIELLLVDDGSTDGSGTICDEYAAKDNRIRVFHKENGGVSSARNLGLDQAQGEYIHFVDSDDIVLQGSYQYLSEVAHSYSPDVIYFGLINDASDNNALIVNDGKFYDSIKDFVKQHYIRVSLCIKIIKRQSIEAHKTRFEPIAYSEDTVFNWDLLRYIGSIFHTSSILYSYTTNPNSAVQNRNFEHVRRTVESLIESNLRLRLFYPFYSDCPSVISNFTHKYQVLFNRILCTPYLYSELKPLFMRCAEIGTSHLATRREIRAYDFLYHHPLFYHLFQSFIRRYYFHLHKFDLENGDFLDGMIEKEKS